MSERDPDGLSGYEPGLSSSFPPFIETEAKAEEEEDNHDDDDDDDDDGSPWCCGRGITNNEEGNEIFHLQKRVWNAFLGLMPSWTVGMAMGSSSPTMEYYSTDPSALEEGPLSQEEGSWFVSILTASMMLGNLLSCPLSDQVGRRQTLVAASAVAVAGWATLAVADQFSTLLVARVVLGLGAGLLDPTSYLMLSEISLIRFRGVLGVLNILMLNLGWLTALILFSWAPCSFNTLLLLCSSPSIAFLVLSRFMEESPLWIAKKGDLFRTEQTLLRLRGVDYPAMEEVREICSCLDKEQDGQEEEEFTSGGFAQKIRAVGMQAHVRRPTLILSVMFFLQISSGADVLCHYSLMIFHRARLPLLSPNQLACLQHAAFVLGYAASAPAMARMRRKKQFVLSAVLMGVSLGVLAACLILKEVPRAIVMFLPSTCFMLTTFFYSFGVGAVCFSLVGELFPAEARAFCSGIVIAVRYLMCSLFLKIFPAQADALGLGGVFVCNALCCFVAVAFVLRFLPETQGLTLTQLEKLFRASEPKELKVAHDDGAEEEAVATQVAAEEKRGKET